MRLDATSAAQALPPPDRVAICSVGELFGGVERHILGLLGALHVHGIEAKLVLFHDRELAAQARDQGFEPIILPGSNLSLLATCRRLAHLLEAADIRIVHAHGYKATVFCGLARRWHRFALVKTEHGLPEAMTGGPLLALRDRSYHFLDRIATRMTAATVCYVTEELRVHHARAHAGLRVTVIPNGVANMDRGQFIRPSELPEDWFNLAVVGRLDPVKGHHVAIEALAASSVPPNVHLQIVGTGPSEPQLRMAAQQHGVADRVHFLGFRRNVYDYLAHCDVLLIPSLHEGLPYTLLEAMALATPIVASRVGGLVEVLRDGITAVLTKPGDPTSIAHAILELRRRPEYGRRLGQDAQRVQRAKYSVEAMSFRYEAIYQGARSMMLRQDPLTT